MPAKKGSKARKAAPPIETLPPDTGMYIEPPEPETPLDTGGIENILHQLGELEGEAKVNVYRMRQGVRPPFAFLFSTRASDFSIEDVAARYGGGEFFIRAWQRGVPGSLINEKFAIEGDPIIAHAAPAMAPNVGSGAQGPAFYQLPNNQGDAITVLGGMMRDTLTQLATMMRPQQPASRFDSMQDTLQMFALFKQISGGSDPMETMTKVLGMMRELQPLTGEGGHADPWSLLQTAAEKILPVLIQGAQRQPVQLPPVQSRGQAPRVEAPPVQFPPRPQPEPPAATLGEAVRHSEQPQQPQPGATPMPTNGGVPPQVRLMIRPLINAARIGADVETYADLITDQIQSFPGAGERIEQFLGSPDWFAQLCRIEPEAVNWPDWFAHLREVLMSPAEEESGDGDGDLTGGGDAGISGAEESFNGPFGGGRH